MRNLIVKDEKLTPNFENNFENELTKKQMPHIPTFINKS